MGYVDVQTLTGKVFTTINECAPCDEDVRVERWSYCIPTYARASQRNNLRRSDT